MNRFRFFLTLTLLACSNAHAQYTDTVIQYFNSTWEKVDGAKKPYVYYSIARKTAEGVWHVQDYYKHGDVLQMEGIFLDDSLTIKDGKFYYYHYNGRLAQECSYNKNNPVGLLRRYSLDGKLLDSARFKSTGIPYHKLYRWNERGQLIAYGEFDMSGSGEGYAIEYYEDSSISSYIKYAKGYVKDSVCTYYHRNGNISLAETYNSGTLIRYDCFDTDGKLMADCDTAIRLPEPGYNVNVFLSENIRMPREALHSNLQGSFYVVTGFVVDIDGSIKDIDLEVGSYKEFNDEALRVIKTMPPWKPGKRHNRVIKVYYNLPVNFRIE